MAKLNFKAGGTGRKLKRTPSKYRESLGRPNISQSAGIRPAFPLMPFKSLPVSFVDVSTEDAVVIPKGRIVSAITSNTDLGTAYDDGDYYGVAKGIMGLMVPCNGNADRDVTSPVEGEDTVTIVANKPIGVAEHDVYQDMRGVNLNYDMRNKNWGVLCQQLIKLPAVDTYQFDLFMGEAGLFVPADATGTDSGNEDITGTFSTTLDLSNATAADVPLTFATYAAAYSGAAFGSITSITADGVAVAEGADAGYTAAAGDIAFDLDGSASAAIVVTFVYDLANIGSGGASSTDTLTGTGYEAVTGAYAFYTYNSENNEGDAGESLISDFYGNWMPGTTAGLVVGSLMGVDYRFNKDLLDTVQSKYDDDALYRLAGTGTFGIPQHLYDFAYKALDAALLKAGTTWAGKWAGVDEAKKIKEAVDAGVFGEAWINLNI
ncbi:hypothetical protein H8D85_02625 [bacterium]|nr:hypothetical protein [bacterium]